MRIRFRNGIASLWSSRNPILALGEPGWDSTNRTFKVGDGTTAWASLASAGGGTSYKGMRPKSGCWYRCNRTGAVGSNLAITLNRVYYVYFELEVATTFDRMGVDVPVAAAATGVARLGLHNLGSDGLPGTVAYDFGTTLIDSTGGKFVTINQAVAAGAYWAAVSGQVATGASLRAVSSYDEKLPYFSGANMFTGTGAPGAIYSDGAGGAFTNNPVIVDNDSGPIIGLRAV